MIKAARALADRGIVTATFDFPYIAEGRKVPDRGPVLEDAWLAAIAEAASRGEFTNLPLFLGGKSMGGRIASQVAASQGSAPIHTASSGHDPWRSVAGLIYLGYPLHPPGKPEQRRDAHLPAISVPMLFVQGSRDAFGSADEIRALLPRLTQAVVHEVVGGDHSFKVPARAHRTQAAVLEEIFDIVAQFIRSCSSV